MKKNKSFIQGVSLFCASVLLLTGCAQSANATPREEEVIKANYSYQVDPTTFAMNIKMGEEDMVVSKKGRKEKVEKLVQTKTDTSWKYPDKNIEVEVKMKAEYLDVQIKYTGDKAAKFTWPRVESDDYYLPIGDGKQIPKEDKVWGEYLNERSINTVEGLSMGFWGTGNKDFSLVYIMDNPYNNTMDFSSKDGITFDFNHEFPSITKNKQYGFRIYPVQNNPVTIAKTYRNYQIEKGNFKTLAEKAEDNPNVSKLFGAPQIYFWNDRLISEKDINWPKFIKAMSSESGKTLINLMDKSKTNPEAVTILKGLKSQGFADSYQKNIICSSLSTLLLNHSLSNIDGFKKQDETAKTLAKIEENKRTETQQVELNKHLLFANMPETFTPVEEWASDKTTDVIADMKQSGINQAWIGFDQWKQALLKPEMVQDAVDAGFLIAPYDSYHSIHKTGEEQWDTAKFNDPSLYEDATVTDVEGNKIEGFQNVGRKLNPVLSLPSVKERVTSIIGNGLGFNSWFIDCDATGEIYDDYSKNHITTQSEDLAARLARMAYIRDDKNMVIGSEGGNDIAAKEIAFAHGIELQSFSWMDKDMSTNKDSKYYLGKYFSATGGVPEKFAKPVPIKQKYYNLFINPAYQLPLYKLVYNDSIITSYHWDWSSYKMKGQEKTRMLSEVLYNVPPMYHLDETEWKTYKSSISKHSAFWSDFSKKVIQLEMTDFKKVSKNGLVQMTEYGDSITVVANYSKKDVTYQGDIIKAQSLLLYENGEKIAYSPSVK